MLSSIHPLGERSKGNRFWLTTTGFVVGSVAGGLALGGLGALLGGGLRLLLDPVIDPAHDVEVAVVAAVALVAAVFEWTGRALPSLRRQVDEDWLQEYRGWVYGLGFGFQLGAGVLTYITSGALLVIVAATVLVGAPWAALVIGATFGAGRGLSLLAGHRVHNTSSLLRLHQRLAATAPAVRRTSMSTLALAGLVAGATLL